MAMTHLNRWIAGDGKKLTNLQKITLRLAVIAEVKEARPTVRSKRPVQQAKVKTEPALCEGMYHGSCKGETMCNPTNACFVPARH